MNSKDFKRIIIDRLATLLKSQNFKKSGNIFRLSNGELTYYISVQSSQSSTAGFLKFTLNIEIASASLYKLEDISLPEKDSRHFVKRIGDYFDKPQDKWWIVSNLQEAEVAAHEVTNILEAEVLPEFARFQTTNDLANLWRQNQCLGLTEKQRREYLSLLEQKSV